MSLKPHFFRSLLTALALVMGAEDARALTRDHLVNPEIGAPDLNATFFIDTQGSMNRNDVAAVTDDSWNRYPSLPFNGGYVRSPVWVRLSIEAPSPDDTLLFLSLSQTQLDTVELFSRSRNGYLRLLARTGRSINPFWPAVADRKPTFAIPFPGQDGDCSYYLRIRTTDVCAVSLELQAREAYLRSRATTNIAFGIFFGAIGAIAFFNLFLFWAIRFTSCLWYALWVLSNALFQASANGFWNMVPGTWPWLASYSIPFFVLGCIVAASLFSIHFLELKKTAPTLLRIFQGFGITAVLLMLALPFDHGRPVAIIASAISAVFVLFCLVAGALSIRHNTRAEVFYTVAISLITLGLLMIVGRNFGFLPHSFLTSQGFLLSSVIEAAILAIALVDRIASLEKEKSAERERAQRFERRAAESRLSALQSQINPHFLFNTLNTLAEMVSSDLKNAETLITDLSRFFRYTLTSSESRTVSLAEELDMARSYLAIEKKRFNDRLDYDVTVDGDPSTCATQGLILQPLVENAIKHGIAPFPSGGRISIVCLIEKEKVYITVRDSGPGFGHSTVTGGTKHGLSNVRERLHIEYGETASLTCSNNNGAVVEIFFPRRDRS